MSQENVEILKKVFEAHRAGGIEEMLPFLDPDVVWDPGPDWIEDDSYVGRDGVRKLNAIWADNFDDYALELHEIRELGECLLGLYEMTGRIKDSGVPIRQPLGVVVSGFRNGMIGEIRSFLSWQQALKAVGLEK